jgi:hypothetical protein
MDWPMESRSQAARKTPWCTRCLVGVEEDAGHLPSAYRHRQRAVGQLHVMVLTQGEPEHPARAPVQHAVQVKLALIGGDLGAVAVSFLVDLGGREVPPD